MFEEEQRPGRSKRLQHFLHAYPTTVPFIVLLLGVGLFSAVVGGQFFHPFNLSLILQQVTIIGIVGIAPDPDHPHRRHRPLGRRDHGPLLGGDGQARGESGVRCRSPSSSAWSPGSPAA